MVTKLVINDEELDIPRGINIPSVGDAVQMKLKGVVSKYVVDGILHDLDYDISIKQGKTLIYLKEI